MITRTAIVLMILTSPLPSYCSDDWNEVWADEFNAPAGAKPDTSKWVYDLGGNGWGNQELQIYTGAPENVSHDGAGNLVIRALKTESGAYTSARLKTLGKFDVKYGRIAARIQLPYGQGIWPAFWMLGTDFPAAGWPGSGEIDVMENVGKEPDIVHGTIHGPGYSGAGAIGGKHQLAKGRRLADDFHVYAVQWSPDRIAFSIDGTEYFEVTPARLPQGAKWVFDHPFFLLVNLAVGGRWPGYPDETTTFPQMMKIDWVRVWQRR